MNENNIEGLKGAGSISSIPPQNPEVGQKGEATTSDVGSLDIVINDMKGIPISGLEFQIKIKDQILASDKTDAKGKGKTIEGMKIGSTFDIYVKTDKGEFKRVAIGTMESEYCVACLTSPKTRFEFSTDVKNSKPGKAEELKKSVIEKSGESPTETTTEHKVTFDKNKEGQVTAHVESVKVKPALAKDIIAALPQVDGKPYAKGIDYEYRTNMDVVPNKLVCNEYIYHAYRIAGETIPPSMVEQIAYFKRHNRFETDMAKGEIGDVVFFSNPPPLREHEVIVIKVKIVDDVKWYLVSGARNEDKVSGMLTSAETESHKEEPIYISQDGKPASMRENKLLPWGNKTTFVRGFKTFVGFGKAGK